MRRNAIRKKCPNLFIRIINKNINAKDNSYIENYIKTVNRYLGKENVSVNKSTYRQGAAGNHWNKKSLNRFYLRRNTADWSKAKQSKEKKCKKVNHPPWKVLSAKNLEQVNERASEQRVTIVQKKEYESSSNESTPRIEEEEIIINTLEGGYSEAIKKSFYDKHLN